jgi:AcrR family transcriptional regulator
MFKTEGKSAETRARILATALELFRERGFEKTTMRDVAAAAGVALGSAYYYFDSKEAIVAAYYEYVQEEHRARAEAAFGEAPDFRARLGVAFHSKLDILAGDRLLLVALFRYGGDPEHALSWFGPAGRRQREKSMAVFEAAVGNERMPADMRALAPLLFWTLHMGITLYSLYDTSPDLARTRRLTDGALDLAVQAKKVASLPLLRPLRRKVIGLLLEAGLLPAGAETPGHDVQTA